MGLQNSKTIKLLREGGWKFAPRVCRKIMHETYKGYKQCNFLITYYLYPKITLSKEDYKNYKTLTKQFKQNYKNIINIDSTFFRKNLQTHIDWIYSEEFKRSVGNNNTINNSSFFTTNEINNANRDNKANTTNNVTTNKDDNKDNITINDTIVTPPPPQNHTLENKEENTTQEQTNTINTYYSEKYPPLLNPKNLDYAKISGELAYELNLPILHDYKFIFLAYGTSGNLAWSTFLTKNNIHSVSYWGFFNQYDKIKNYENIYINIACVWRQEEQMKNKILAFLNHTKDILMIVRDPIARLKTMINHGRAKDWDKWKNPIFTITENVNDIVNSCGFCNEYYDVISDAPVIYNKLLQRFINDLAFSYTTNISYLPKTAKIRYYDIESIMPKNAFNTITNLAKEFDFDLPKEEERAFYEDIKFGTFSYILPLKCMLTLNNQERILHITTKYNRDSSLLEIKEYLFEEDRVNQSENKNILNDTPNDSQIMQSQAVNYCNKHQIFLQSKHLLNDLSFSMEEKDFLALKNNESLYKEVKTYMKKFLIALKKRIDFINKHKKTENDILEYLSMDKELRNKLKTLLDRELAHIKEHRPDIVDSWKYYKEFERICEEEL